MLAALLDDREAAGRRAVARAAGRHRGHADQRAAAIDIGELLRNAHHDLDRAGRRQLRPPDELARIEIGRVGGELGLRELGDRRRGRTAATSGAAGWTAAATAAAAGCMADDATGRAPSVNATTLVRTKKDFPNFIFFSLRRGRLTVRYGGAPVRLGRAISFRRRDACRAASKAADLSSNLRGSDETTRRHDEMRGSEVVQHPRRRRGRSGRAGRATPA